MSLKQNWDNFLQYSVGLAAALAIITAAIGLMMVVGAVIVISKIMVFIK